MQKNKISIVVPVYNKEKYIKNFIKSVIKQTYTNFELILVNDGSTDNSIIVAEEILKDSKLEYKIINKSNGGQSSARNAGIKVAEGEWIVIPDSDDTLQKDYLKIMINSVIGANSEVGICDLEYVSEDNIFEESKRTSETIVKNGKDFFADFVMHKIEIGPVSLIIKKEFLEMIQIAFNEKSNYSEEFIFITDLLYNATNVIHIKEKLYNYCLRQNSVSTGAGINKILNGFNEIKKYSKKYLDKGDEYSKIYNKYALARWIIATARFTSSYLKYKEYKILMKELNAKKEVRKLLLFPEIRIKAATIIFLISEKLFYKISK